MGTRYISDAAPVKAEPKARASVNMPKGCKMKGDMNLAECEIGKNITLTITGKVMGMNQDEYGKRLEIEPSSVSYGKEKDA